MDPITLEKLLTIANAIEEHRKDNRLAFSEFGQIIAKETNAKDLTRRKKDILRILTSIKWVVIGDPPNILCLTQYFTDFVGAWDEGDLQHINSSLANYPPYDRFLTYLRDEKAIRVPKRGDRQTRELLKSRLKEYNITFPAFNTFQYWAISTGQAYLSPFEETFYWGGNWNEVYPSLEIFEATLRECYNLAKKTSGYASIGHVADAVCRRLYLSFQAFEVKMNNLIKIKSDQVKLAAATIREPSRGFIVTTIRPRSKVLEERLTANLVANGTRVPKLKWLEHRYVEDGIRINGRLVKLMRWEIVQ